MWGPFKAGSQLLQHDDHHFIFVFHVWKIGVPVLSMKTILFTLKLRLTFTGPDAN